MPPRFGPPPHHETPTPMPWTWKRTDDRTGVNVYDHTDRDDPVLTIPMARSAGITTLNGTPEEPDVRAAITDYLAEQTGEGYVRDATLDIALWGVRKRPSAEDADDDAKPARTRGRGPPTDTPAAATAEAYKRARDSDEATAVPPGATGTLVVGDDRADPRGDRDTEGDR